MQSVISGLQSGLAQCCDDELHSLRHKFYRLRVIRLIPLDHNDQTLDHIFVYQLR